MNEKLPPMSKETFMELKARYEAAGYKVINQWRPGTKVLKLAEIVLSEQPNTTQAEGE